MTGPDANDRALQTGILDQMYDGVYLVDTQRSIQFWNRGAERISGYPAQEILGTRCSDNLLMHIDEEGTQLCREGCPLAATIADGEPREAEVYLHHKEGHRVPVHVRAAPLRDAEGRIIGAIEVFSDNSARSALREEIERFRKLALIDPLTDVGNRRYAETALTSRHDELERYGWAYGVLLVDIDCFKSFNDRFGHETGDRVLRMVAQSLAAAVRSFDVVGRWGGEEFVVVIEKVNLEDMVRRADMLRRLVEASSLTVDGQQLSVTISIGGTIARPGEKTTDTLKRADEFLYRSKEMGRNRVTCE